MSSIAMTDYGFSDRFAALAGAYPALTVGRVLSQEKGIYNIVCPQGEQAAEVSGRFRYEAQTVSDYPAVGDFIMLSEAGRAIIHHVLPRKSVFLRKAAGTAQVEQVVAANIDTVFLCMALNSDYNPRRLERYLSVAWDSGASPVVVLTKADLCTDLADKRRETEAAAMGADILVTSSLEDDGLRQLAPYLKPGRTIALIGSSGVGKSTLINRMLGHDQLKTNGLRNDGKGRHTTTHRELLLLPQGGAVIDTPGMRELGLWDASEGIGQTFADIEALSRQCRFGDCTHTKEPGCAICAALREGTLSEERWTSYQKLKTENAFVENSDAYLAAKKQKFRDIAKVNKSNRKR